MNQKKAGVAILNSDKIDLKEYYERQKRTLHNDKGISLTRKYNIVNVYSISEYLNISSKY